MFDKREKCLKRKILQGTRNIAKNNRSIRTFSVFFVNERKLGLIRNQFGELRWRIISELPSFLWQGHTLLDIWWYLLGHQNYDKEHWLNMDGSFFKHGTIVETVWLGRLITNIAISQVISDANNCLKHIWSFGHWCSSLRVIVTLCKFSRVSYSYVQFVPEFALNGSINRARFRKTRPSKLCGTQIFCYE